MEVTGRGCLKPENFLSLIDKNPSFRRVELANAGEIFLNPGLKEIIKLASDRGVVLSALSGTNLNTIAEDTIEALVKYRFQAVSVSIDGIGNQVYQIFRRGGDFNAVIANIKKINSYKLRYKTPLPRLVWQFVVFGHNQHQIQEARRMAGSLNMDFKLKFNAHDDYSPVQDTDSLRQEMGASSRREYRQRYNKLYMFCCHQLWTAPQINWDGRLLGCCVNKWGDFGNVFESGLEECLKSGKYRYAKRMIAGKSPAKKDIPCFYCSRYREMAAKNDHFKLGSYLLSSFLDRVRYVK